jgi:glyoxylase-like metal-dependent hydrolase (beta-lactamase superfamily II)
VTEPKTVATGVQEVVPGVWHWSIHDDRIDYISASHAVAGDEGTVLIDPLRLTDEALGALGNVTAICLTTSEHQRASWHYRRKLGAEVYAPALAKQVEEEPDVRYSEGDALPGGLRPIFTPGAGTTQHTFLLDRDGGVAFVPDYLVRSPGREVRVIPEEYAQDIDQAHRTVVEKLLELHFAVLCLGHGEPVTADAKAKVRAALDA